MTCTPSTPAPVFVTLHPPNSVARANTQSLRIPAPQYRPPIRTHNTLTTQRQHHTELCLHGHSPLPFSCPSTQDPSSFSSPYYRVVRYQPVYSLKPQALHSMAVLRFACGGWGYGVSPVGSVAEARTLFATYGRSYFAWTWLARALRYFRDRPIPKRPLRG